MLANPKLNWRLRKGQFQTLDCIGIPDIRHPLVIAILIAIWVIALRLPAFHFSAFDQDEALFLLIGKTWLDGGRPYVDMWDLKPPGLFLIFMAAEWIFGATVESARLAAMAAVCASAYGLFLIGRRWLGSDWVGWIAALAYPRIHHFDEWPARQGRNISGALCHFRMLSRACRHRRWTVVARPLDRRGRHEFVLRVCGARQTNRRV